MKIKTDFRFPDEYRKEAEEYVSFKQSLGFKVGYDNQKMLSKLMGFLYRHNAEHDVTNLTRETSDSFLMQYSDARPRTVHANQSLIRQYGLFLKRKGLDPFVFPDMLIQCPKDFMPYIFSKEEIRAVFKCADSIGPNKNKFVNTPHIYPAVFRVLYACGSRIGETLVLKNEDVDLCEGIITFKNGKNGVSRMVPMSYSLTCYLRKYDSRVERLGNDYFFPALKGECYSAITIRNTFRKLMAQAGIQPMSNGRYPRVHDLRHTFAVHSLEHAIENGTDPYCSLPALSTYMGHKGVESTEYYLRLTRHYFMDVLHYTCAQADAIFPEVE